MIIDKLHMESQDTLAVLTDRYGLTIEPYDENDNDEKETYIKIDRNQLANVDGIFRDIPFLVNQAQKQNYYSGAYKVIYDKGLGELQKSAKTPGLFRANIVTPGTNNDVIGQAELASLNLTEAMKVSQVALSAYSIAAVITNQYYLANINERLCENYEAQAFSTCTKKRVRRVGCPVRQASCCT